jgi:hypothetical protein
MRVLIAFVALIALYPNESDACSCIGPQPACAAVWTADDVFSGTVLEIKKSASGKRVTFRVDRMWHSTTNRTVKTLDVETGIGGGDCGFPFREGGQYLVYASGGRGEQVLSTGICSNTRMLEHAAEDLAYLKSLAEGGLLSRIWGQVLIRHPNDEWIPLPNVMLDLHRGDDLWTTTSDAEGRFEFVDLPPALYHVFARDYLVETGLTSARLRAPSACAELTLFVKRPPGP